MSTTADQFKRIDNSGIEQYLANKKARSQYTFTINCEGECFYNFDGIRLSEQDFNDLFPLQSLNRNSKGNRIGGAQQIV